MLLILLAPPDPLTLRVRIAPDDSARVAGTLRVQERVLVATGAGQARCADADGDGFAGVVRLEIPVRDARSSTLGRVVLETMPGEEIEGTGFFTLVLEVDAERTTLDAEVRVQRESEPRRRRHKR